MKTMFVGYLLIVLVVSQSNDAFDDVTGSPTVGAQARQQTTQPQQTTTSSQPQTNVAGTQPQNFQFARNNFGETLRGFDMQQLGFPGPFSPMPGNFQPAPITTAPVWQPPANTVADFGSATLPLASRANVNLSEPIQVGSYVQNTIGQDQRVNYQQFVPELDQTCCAAQTPHIAFLEDFERTTQLSNIDYKLFRGRGGPNPGNYLIAPSPLTPWNYHNCRANGRHLWVNGINSNWSPYFRRIYSQTVPVQKATYRLCFKARNLPQCSWDAKPFGFINLTLGSTTNSTYWLVDNGTNAANCRWQNVVSHKFKADVGNLQISISLFNGEIEDGNDLVIDDVQLIRLTAPRNQPSFNYELAGTNGLTFNLRMASKFIPSGNCRDNFYLRNISGNFVLQAANVEIKTSNQYTYNNLQILTSYEVGIKRICDCVDDSFWRISFNLGLQIIPQAQPGIMGQPNRPNVMGSPQPMSQPGRPAWERAINNDQGQLGANQLSTQNESNSSFDV